MDGGIQRHGYLPRCDSHTRAAKVVLLTQARVVLVMFAPARHLLSPREPSTKNMFYASEYFRINIHVVWKGFGGMMAVHDIQG